MLGEIDFLMTDDFVAFAEKIKGIKTEKERLTVEIKEAYAKYEADIAALDQQAAQIYEDFKAAQEKPAE